MLIFNHPNYAVFNDDSVGYALTHDRGVVYLTKAKNAELHDRVDFWREMALILQMNGFHVTEQTVQSHFA